MKTISLAVRARILAAYDRPGRTRAHVAQRFGVSLGMVKKLLQQRQRLGTAVPQHHRAGRKPKILLHHRQQFQALLNQHPELTLAELRMATGLTCSLPAICHALADLGLSYKKRSSVLRTRSRQRYHDPQGKTG